MFTVGEAGLISNANDGQEQRKQHLIQQVAGNSRLRRFTMTEILVMNTRNEYLANPWRTADQPLHQQQWVQSEMAKFHDTRNSLEHRQCVTCNETWPSKQRFNPQIFECHRCKRDYIYGIQK